MNAFKFALVASVFCLGSHVSAAPSKPDRIISIRIDSLYGDAPMKSAHLLVRDGASASIEEAPSKDGKPGSFVEVESRIGADSAVFMAFKVGRIVNGAKIIDASPQIVTKSGQQAVLTQRSEGKPELELRATPKILD